MDWYLGTVGYSYEDWDGVFYPEGMKNSAYLGHYSQVFNAVELDTTFYGAPSPQKVVRWANAVPNDFIFCPKTPRTITHDMRLANAAQPMQHFVGAVRGFGHRLGAILIQLPPNFDSTQAPLLESFLAELPTDLRFAVEFRHASWFNGAARHVLSQHNVAWVSNDFPGMPPQVTRTADFLFMRWMGKHGQYVGKTHERIDRTARLQWWFDQMSPHFTAVNTVYGFMNNDYAGYSPGCMNKFKRVAGLSVTKPEVYRQTSLFDFETQQKDTRP